MNKIKRVSLFFRIIFQIIFIAIPILLIFSWIYAPEPLNLFIGIIKFNAIPSTYAGPHVYAKGAYLLHPPMGAPEPVLLHILSWKEKCLGFLVSLLPTTIDLIVLYCLIKLFRLYEQGEIFSINNVKYIRNIGYALLIGQLLNPIYQGLMGIVLTWNNPKGHRFAAISLDQTNLGILLVGLMVILISWIMTEGCRLREEQQLTI